MLARRFCIDVTWEAEETWEQKGAAFKSVPPDVDGVGFPSHRRRERPDKEAVDTGKVIYWRSVLGLRPFLDDGGAKGHKV